MADIPCTSNINVKKAIIKSIKLFDPIDTIEPKHHIINIYVINELIKKETRFSIKKLCSFK